MVLGGDVEADVPLSSGTTPSGTDLEDLPRFGDGVLLTPPMVTSEPLCETPYSVVIPPAAGAATLRS